MTNVFAKIGLSEINTSEYGLPSDRVFREAWALGADGNVIHVDMATAKNIWREKIRTARKKEFARLDTEFMLALERGQDTTKIVEEKQMLRDAPQHPDIEAAQTPEQLIQFQPISGVIIK